MGIKSMLIALAIPAMTMAAALPQEVGTLIVGGEPAVTGDFPFIVSLSRSGSHFCGGSLLNANTVLTAAHCAQGQSAANIRVRAGSLNRGSGGVQVGVSSIRIHPSYSSSTLNNDVAILKLSSPIAASGNTIGYASLPASGSDPAAGSSTTVAGWGTTSQNGASSTTLRKVTVPVISRTSCRSSYGSSAVTDNMWCAGLAQGGKDSCQGDSGGPIVETSSKVLIGAVSWGEGCAQPNAPGVYARVGTLLPFIQQNL